MNDHEMNNVLAGPAPPPRPEAMEAAWSAAVGEFRRKAGSPPGSALTGWFWPLAAAATIAALCGIIAVQSRTAKPLTAHSGTSASGDLVQLFSQGRELFGDRLEAVEVAKDRVVWHLSEDATPAPASDQVVTVVLDRGAAPNLHIAIRPGTLVDVEQSGQMRRIEFLPDVTGRIIAVGDGIYWEAESPDSPMLESRLREVCLNP